MDKEPDGGDMVFQLFTERQGLTDKSAYSLSERAVETLDVLGAVLPRDVLAVLDGSPVAGSA